MGFGAIIATGDSNQPLPDDLAGAIAEARVELPLDGPAQFAVRFIDDLRDGRPLIADDPRLAIGTLVSVLVEVDGALVCLVRGPITDHRSRMMLGGPGTSFDVIGLDRLDLLDRACVRRRWTGRASEAAQTILSGTFDQVDVEETPRVYEDRSATLNQRVTDLDFLQQIAQRNNLHLWVSYEASRAALTGAITVTETANLISSPRRPEGAAGLLAGAISLIPTSEIELRVQVPNEQNVTEFEISIDSRRPSQFEGGSMPWSDANPVTTRASDPQPAAGGGAIRLAQLGGTPRELCMVGSGDPTETQSRAEAALTEAGWFVRATASTSMHLLGGVLRPHDVVRAVGVGPQLGETAFRVRSATHVITAAHHMIDAELDANALGAS
ncbi:MAG: hypothetical protein CMM50_18020 [Rhodospirillaceae bacterium]|nr:hypothetical protein [Rhodospirillaceae bacterium]